MAITAIAGTLAGSSGGGAAVTTGSIDTTGATLLVVAIACYHTSDTVVSDNKSNTWTALTVRTSGFYRNRLFYCKSPTVGSGHTFTATNSYNSIAVYAFSGTDGSDAESENGATATSGTSLQPGSVTPTVNGSLVITSFMGHYTESHAITGFTKQDITQSSGAYPSLGLAYLVQTTAAAINPTWTWTFSPDACASAIAVFKPSSGGASKPVLFHSHFRSQGW
jgi:hypothetical protein